MMRNITKKWAAILCAVLVVLVLAAYLGVMLFAILSDAAADLVVYIVMALYAALILTCVWGVIAALRQRMSEIDGGEEDDAKQY